MTDRRLRPSNGRVAALSLQGQVAAERFVKGDPVRVVVPVTDLCAAPAGARDRQQVLGQQVRVFEDRDGWSFVQADDGYVGYIASGDLGIAAAPTHRVATFATHAYVAADMKSRDVMSLPFGAMVNALQVGDKFVKTPQGFIPRSHLRPIDRPFVDPATVAQVHFGTPYLWGGNSTRGIDCSGLVAASFRACGLACPADSDMQRADLGEPLAEDSGLTRGDLIFWDGHVGMMVDDVTMIHANAHAMAVAYEPLDRAIARIKAQGDGPVLMRKRVAFG